MSIRLDASVQECLDALEAGCTVTCWDGSTLSRRTDGTYVYRPFLTSSLLAIRDEETTCQDLESLLAFIVLREASYERETTTLILPHGKIVESLPVAGSRDTQAPQNAGTPHA